jgi:NADP-dependent 3-hydroxy acid dehydrogenase YdfG
MTTTPKVELVTGASSGFGQATATGLSAQGLRLRQMTQITKEKHHDNV